MYGLYSLVTHQCKAASPFVDSLAYTAIASSVRYRDINQ